MIIILRYIYNNMLEKIGKLILLLAAISLSTGTLIASLGVVNVGVDILTKAEREVCENKDIGIVSDQGEESFKVNCIKEVGIKDLEPQIVYGVSYGEDNENRITIYGRENEYINSSLLYNKTLEGFRGKKCIISIRTSKDYNLKVGDKLTIEIKNKEIDLEIYALANNEGVFYGDKQSNFTIVLPYKFLANILEMNGRYNYITANKTEETIQQSVDQFNAANKKKYKASLLYNENASTLSTLIMPLYMMLGIIVLMSIIIIYSSFRLTITERLKVIGTFLSQGATIGLVKRIFYLESIIYGIIGGIIGDLIGAGIISITGYVISPLKEYGIIEHVQAPISYYVIGLVFSVVLALVSVVLPIQAVNKLQIKELILNTSNEVKEVNGNKKFVIGLVLLAIVIGMSRLPKQIVMYLSMFLLIGLIVAVIMIMPKVIVSLSKIIFKRLKGISPVNSIALNNVSTSKILLDNIVLMFVSILIVIMINSVGNSLQNIVSEGYENFNYDLRIKITGGEYGTDVNGIEHILKKHKSISSSQEYYSTEANLNGESVQMIGIDAGKYREYDHYNNWMETGNKQVWENFVSGSKNAAIITNKVADKFKLKEGDLFKLELNEMTEVFKVAGIINARMYEGNYFIMCNKTIFPDSYKIKNPSMIICTTSADSKSIKKELQKEISKKGGKILTFEEVKKDSIEANSQIFVILNLFSAMALIISGLGVLNNISIGFIQRKKSMVVLSSVGMSVEQRGGMLITESILTVFWPVLMVYIVGSFSMKLMGEIISFMMGIEMKVEFDVGIMPQSIVIALGIMLIATIPVILRNKKFCIVEELKYE